MLLLFSLEFSIVCLEIESAPFLTSEYSIDPAQGADPLSFLKAFPSFELFLFPHLLFLPFSSPVSQSSSRTRATVVFYVFFSPYLLLFPVRSVPIEVLVASFFFCIYILILNCCFFSMR